MLCTTVLIGERSVDDYLWTTTVEDVCTSSALGGTGGDSFEPNATGGERRCAEYDVTPIAEASSDGAEGIADYFSALLHVRYGVLVSISDTHSFSATSA